MPIIFVSSNEISYFTEKEYTSLKKNFFELKPPSQQHQSFAVVNQK